MNTQHLLNLIKLRIGSDAHVAIQDDGSIQLLVTNSLFISAVRKIETAKTELLFENIVQRTDQETAVLNQIIECMRECQSTLQPLSISLLHPEKASQILFTTKQ
ncbi:hypothetical protein [Weissella cibaria]|uniref:hypothetical protein n=1 Tax=Weissella cibaria TaxID=137591 RepID=UPI0013DB61EF|nr:hypothetical protein [Weissella cibaria]NFA01874.1 hypothetical protein [Weissella cibaria]